MLRFSLFVFHTSHKKEKNKGTHIAQTSPSAYIKSTADSHLRVTRRQPLRGAGPGQMVITAAAGISTREGGERLQRQMLVQQTAEQTETDSLEKNKKNRKT